MVSNDFHEVEVGQAEGVWEVREASGPGEAGGGGGGFKGR